MKPVKRVIRSITIYQRANPDADTSYIGEYTDTYAPGNIVATGSHKGKLCKNVKAEDLPLGGLEFKYFKPYAGGEKVNSRMYCKFAKEDFKRMNDLQDGEWYYLGIVAKAEVILKHDNGCGIVQTITSGGLWGIESDSDERYLKEIADEELATLKNELLGYGFAEKDIDKAFKKATTKNDIAG